MNRLYFGDKVTLHPVVIPSDFNALLGGPLEAIDAECGFLDKFLRVVAETPLLQFIDDANPCQESGEPACLIETTCAGCGP